VVKSNLVVRREGVTEDLLAQEVDQISGGRARGLGSPFG